MNSKPSSYNNKEKDSYINDHVIIILYHHASYQIFHPIFTSHQYFIHQYHTNTHHPTIIVTIGIVIMIMTMSVITDLVTSSASDYG